MSPRRKCPETVSERRVVPADRRQARSAPAASEARSTGSAGIPSALSEPDLPSGRGRVFLRQYELVERVLAYQPSADVEALNRAYVFAMVKHGEQKRHSGDPYFAHPVSVAGLLTDLQLDETAIIAGLLHDTVEDTGATLAEIADGFGDDVAKLVDGVTKIGRLSGLTREQGDAANFQKFILATAGDIRVLLVKLADRLHNMRTLDFMPSELSRQRIARDTMEIYGPLARRIGLSVMAAELEDLSFRALEPDQQATIWAHLVELARRHEADVCDICAEIERFMAEGGIDGEVRGRIKRPFDIWRKLECKSVALEQISDIFAFRLIVDGESTCYRALGLAHRHWAALPGGVKDYISVPKPNGYRSLHTKLRRPGGHLVELQIRTAKMHAVAERGVAAHWRYKCSAYGFDREAAKAEGLDVVSDLTALADMLAHGADPEEFLEHAKLELYRDSVFVFTPKGRLIKLPAGAMPLDFAYALHSDIGDTCSGARINGRAAPLRTPLRNGDMVELERRSDPGPHPDWECLVVTGRARSAIRRMIRIRHRKECETLGRTLLRRQAGRAGIDPDQLDVKALLRRAGLGRAADLLVALGEGRIAVGDLLAAKPSGRASSRRGPYAVPALAAGEDLTPGVSLQLSDCCSPLPGDRIVGLMTGEDGGRLRVHVCDCDRLDEEAAGAREQVNLVWRQNGRGTPAVARLTVTTVNARGVLAKLCQAVSDADGNISNLTMIRRRRDFFDMRFDIEVGDRRHTARILAAMRALQPVVSARREGIQEEPVPA